MFAFIWWLLVGLIAGALARFLIPGEQPMGWPKTLGLGLIGSVLGGLLASALFETNARDTGFHVGGVLMSTIGAMIVLGLYVSYLQRRAS